ncbi:hypothetical protein RHABOEDO_001371 [Candidatus Rhabdochlamydia oedothoracis]|uniref:Uncharacterized protein n=1 Tax=Candidatus Rhabdochlamydia oedothoracis TaxID=2720720 RepID=A0ABX8V7B4_9BACT|nr:hypothetical protein RHABOEDO_001371 [Candidatus Rhabdochlamydia oedothoracis]
MLGCTIDVFSSIYMFFFVHFKVERAFQLQELFDRDIEPDWLLIFKKTKT